MKCPKCGNELDTGFNCPKCKAKSYKEIVSEYNTNGEKITNRDYYYYYYTNGAQTREAEIEALKAENAELTAQLENAVVLPCKVGDTVWKIIIEFAKDGSTKPIGIESGIVSMFQQLKNGQWKFRISKGCDDYVSEFGKIYFITEAEAEARLKELED